MYLNKVSREPDFENILKVLKCEKPNRPTLFEFFMNNDVYEEAAGPAPKSDDPLEHLKYLVKAFTTCGYDYTTAFPYDFGCDIDFTNTEVEHKDTISLNANSLIESWDDFNSYPWPDSSAGDYSVLKKAEEFLPHKMKLMAAGPGGLLENVISIVGYENLCYLIYDEPELVKAIFDKVGSILLDYYQHCVAYDTVGMLMINDDWGFNTQTMLSVPHMREYIFPWHKKMVETAHSHNKPAILHSCGYIPDIMEDVIEDMKYDGRHSYEDNIIPVEEAYKRWGGRIAILGGIDVDFLIRSDESAVYKRAANLLEMSSEKGGYALGSGNSIPSYVPKNKYFTMTSAVNR